jgi:hypothetical protein
MKSVLLAGLALAATCLAPIAVAQKSERVVVTGSMITRDGSDMPYVSLRVPAEFVIFLIELETGTRSEDDRARELERTYTALVQRVSRTPGVTIEAGDAYESAPIETTAVRELILQDEEDEQRSEIRLVLTVPVRPGDTFAGVRARAEQMIEQVQPSGRVEIVMGDTQYIGVSDPKTHREALLRQIASDTELLQSLFGRGATGPAAISLSGLERRVQSRPVGPLELEMYVNYEMALVQAPRN